MRKHREGPPSSVGMGTLCRRERQRKGESPYLFLELRELASTFSSQQQSPWFSGLWTQAPLLWDHGEISVVQGEQLEQGSGDARGQSSYQPVLFMC